MKRLFPSPARPDAAKLFQGLLLSESQTQVIPQMRLQMDQPAKSWLLGRQVRQEVN